MKMNEIHIRYDGKKLKFTKEYILAIKDLMRAEILMMRKNYPESKDMWVCGVAQIKDLSSFSEPINEMFGPKADRDWLKRQGDIFIEVPLEED